MTTASITFRGIPMEVEGSYHPDGPDTWACPGDPGEFNAEEIYIGEHEVSHLLAAHKSAIEAAAFDWCVTYAGKVHDQRVRDFSPVEVD